MIFYSVQGSAVHYAWEKFTTICAPIYTKVLLAAPCPLLSNILLSTYKNTAQNKNIHRLTIKLLHSARGYSKHHKSQIIRARELKFWDNVHPPPHVSCQVSGVRCQVSGVTYFFFFFQKWWGYSVEGLLSTGPTRLVSIISRDFKTLPSTVQYCAE